MIESALRSFLGDLGEDAYRTELVKTPSRFAKAYKEMLKGYAEDPLVILEGNVGDCPSNAPMFIDGIKFTSVCEHHLLPFFGEVVVGFLPTGDLLGLSKVHRLVGCLSRRLQVQERLTLEIAETLATARAYPWVGVAARATHTCVLARGVEQPGSNTMTYAYAGARKDDKDLRSDFVNVCRLSWA